MAGSRPIFALTLLAALLAGTVAAQNPPASSGKSKRKARVAADDRAGTIVVKAETALENKDYAAAEAMLKSAVEEDPNDFRAWFDLGFVYGVTGRKPEAAAAYRKSVALDPKVFESNLNLGLVLAQTSDPEAEKYLRAATQLKPTARPDEGRARAWLSLGHVLETGDPAGALAAYAQAAELQPKDAEPHLSSGALFQRREQLAEAEQAYRKAAELDPKAADASLGLANLYQKSGRLPEAEAALRKYLELEPQDLAASIQLGRILTAQHKRYEAIDVYEAVLTAHPDASAAAGAPPRPGDMTVQLELASLYDLAGKFDKSEALFRAALTAHPNIAEIHAGLGAVLLHQHKAAEAQNELLTAVKLNPRLGEAYGDLALAASENKNYELTIRALEARAKLLPENAGSYFLRATAYDHLRDRERAAQYYREFLRVDEGRAPDQEWQAKHRLLAIEPKK